MSNTDLIMLILNILTLAIAGVIPSPLNNKNDEA